MLIGQPISIPWLCHLALASSEVTSAKGMSWKRITSSLWPCSLLSFDQKKMSFRGWEVLRSTGYLGNTVVSAIVTINCKVLYQASERMGHNCPEVHLRNKLCVSGVPVSQVNQCSMATFLEVHWKHLRRCPYLAWFWVPLFRRLILTTYRAMQWGCVRIYKSINFVQGTNSPPKKL